MKKFLFGAICIASGIAIGNILTAEEPSQAKKEVPLYEYVQERNASNQALLLSELSIQDYIVSLYPLRYKITNVVDYDNMIDTRIIDYSGVEEGNGYSENMKSLIRLDTYVMGNGGYRLQSFLEGPKIAIFQKKNGTK